jgi:hypothetical protein
MKRTVPVLLFGASAAAIFLIQEPARTQAQITNPQPAPAASDLQSVTLVFGAKDTEPTGWNGSVSITGGGRIEKVEGWHFPPSGRISGNSWETTTSAWGVFSGGMHPNEKPQPRATSMEPTGVTIYFRAPDAAVLTVKLPKGEFAFRPMDLPEQEGLFPLAATVEVYRTPPVEQISGGEMEDDYPSIAADGDSVWVAWQGYKDRAETLFLRRWRGGAWGETRTVSEKPGDLFGTALTARNGAATVVWSERIGEAWHIRARHFDGTRLASTETVATSGNNLFHRAVADRDGNLHVAYQSARGGRSDIYLRSRIAGKWTNELNLSDPRRDVRANDWMPSIAAASDGTVWTAWDGYADGNYNVYLRPVKSGRAGELMKVTNSTRYHACASVTVDQQNRVWVAYDEAPENWGKDVGFLLTGGTGIYDSRTIKVAVWDGAKWMAPRRQPGDVVPWSYKRYFHTPRITADSRGRIWLLARPRTSARLPTTIWAAGGKWEVQATYYSGDRWSELQIIPESVARNEGDMALAADSGGGVWAAFVTDHRLWGGANFGEAPRNNDIMVTRLSGLGTRPPELAARGGEEPSGLASEPREKEQIARVRSVVIPSGGKQLRVYRGDWHRHTDISMDGAGDGSLWGSYRYAMDAAGMDWLGVTDHQSGTSEYTWWRIQKSADMFHVPGFFTAAYAVERSLVYPNGHRNLMYPQRGVADLPSTPDERAAKVNTGSILYPYLRKNNGVATSHTSHTTMGTDWRDNDPELEPVVEIFQGARTNAEHEGAPLAPTANRTELWAGNYRPLGFVWNAWAKGYKLGVQASSDHVSTHTSYACIIAESAGRQALIDAIKARHTYAATSNIVMDFRLAVNGKSFIQGDSGAGSGAPELTANIHGTGALKRVVIVRDNRYIFSNEPTGESFDLRFRDTESLPAGEHYYYVRAEQRDGNVAWSSPIWVKR